MNARAPLFILGILSLFAGCAPAPLALPASLGPDPWIIIDLEHQRYVDIADVARDVADADVVFFGEFHEDSIAHSLQVAFLEEIAARRGDVALGLEMFERDVQEVIDDWLRGETSDDDFLGRARPWPNYDVAYRPLVDIARAEGWPVVATNLPQFLASAIARGGLSALDTLAVDQRRFAAAESQCGDGDYWDRFVAAIIETADSSGHQAFGQSDPMLRNMFEAQCARDEAMAESIAGLLQPGRLVVHINGAFHSDFRLGTVARLVRRRPDARVRTISAIPLEDLDPLDMNAQRDRADYLILTP